MTITATRPQMHVREAYDLHELVGFVETKLGISALNEVWHWFADRYEPNNGSYHTLRVKRDAKQNKRLPDVVRTVLEELNVEFGESIPVFVEW